MSEHDATLPQTAPQLTAAAVLGLTSPEGEDWSRLRGLQYSALDKLTPVRLLSHTVLAALAVWLLHGSVDPLWLWPWLAAVLLVQMRGLKTDRQLAGADRRQVKLEDMLAHCSTPLLTGTLWAVALAAFAPVAGGMGAAAVWAAVGCLVLSSVVFYSVVPLGVVVFTGVLSLGGLIGLWRMDMLELAPLVAGFAAMAAIGAVKEGRAMLKARISEVSIAEKDAVVSLLLREFEENEADWLWEIDPARRTRGVSPRFAFALGIEAQQAEGKPILELIAGRGWEGGALPASLHELANKLQNRQSFSNLMVEVSIRGSRRWWELSGTPMLDERGKFLGFRGVGSDVTAQRRSSEKIAYLARYDTLTSLPNRLQLTEAIGDAMNYAGKWRTRCAFLMIDLDRFKSVNDSLGHQIGDALLAQVSARLKALMGENQLCGRLGGDEFAVVIRDATDHRVIERVAQLIIERLSEPYAVENHTLFVGASVGSAIAPRDGRTVEELMRNADLALYRAKDGGGGQHCQFEPILHASAEERRKLELSLRGALDREELALQYQPVVDAKSEQVVSFEALVRWHSPEHGFVSPAKFIPVAEDTRMILPIGRWVLRQACREARKWPENVKVNVNVSPEQLLDPAFTDDVVKALSDSGLRPQRLEVEVTESIFLRDASLARSALEQVMALGCSVALDDFGTGYSSLGYIRKLRFSTIKIDRTFVKGAEQQSAESLAIIRAVVAMAQSLDMTTTAEGVETIEEVEMIRALGCDKIQGYYFGRPMDSEDALKLFNEADRRRA
ncbi:EAL domain-containing protein [Altererythrobacter sp. BO-6]|uniref:putative bifunctional diguanylate cyclase/phosphodiesterase n=1 Tax=Altererythrobacter sp. BO-6 TaxID=2604537 RepID=UPI0013E11091|nr:EAL domain-containing protein [Altererythrobacter sp. BO-6]QIG53383.1 EAL domain-containing protein [Altererythrobacter sp. BO-6]